MRGRSVAEWTSLGISLAILLGVAGMVIYLYVTDDNRQPIIEIVPLYAEVRHDGEVYYLPVTVTNTGDETAANVQVRGELQSQSGPPETAEFEIEYLAGEATASGTMVFGEEPTTDTLKVLPVSFQEP